MEQVRADKNVAGEDELSAEDRVRLEAFVWHTWQTNGDADRPRVHFLCFEEVPDELPNETRRLKLRTPYVTQAYWITTFAPNEEQCWHLFIDSKGLCGGGDLQMETLQVELQLVVVRGVLYKHAVLSTIFPPEGRVEFARLVDGWVEHIRAKNPWHYRKLTTSVDECGYGLSAGTPGGRERMIQEYFSRLVRFEKASPLVDETFAEISRLLRRYYPLASWYDWSAGFLLSSARAETNLKYPI